MNNAFNINKQDHPDDHLEPGLASTARLVDRLAEHDREALAPSVIQRSRELSATALRLASLAEAERGLMPDRLITDRPRLRGSLSGGPPLRGGLRTSHRHRRRRSISAAVGVLIITALALWVSLNLPASTPADAGAAFNPVALESAVTLAEHEAFAMLTDDQWWRSLVGEEAPLDMHFEDNFTPETDAWLDLAEALHEEQM